MTPERWRRVKDVLAAALEVDPSERQAHLERACAGDPAMRGEIESLLAVGVKGGPDALTVPIEVSPGGSPANTRIGRRIGPYQAVGEIGIGGMGEVYRAFRADDQYQKEVAIKLVRAGQDSGFVINRFKNERQILATLDHPNIARLLDGGTTEDGLPYFVMELIEGQPVDEYCSRHKLSVSERLNLFLQVCSAVQYAHQRLIIHRDIKPGNILVTADGTPKLLDFGIAKLLDTNAIEGRFEPTLTMFRVLTPAYASPEQVKGQPITTASDVYSLGVVLYELLTGHHPYGCHNGTPQEIARAVCEVEPDKPSIAVRKTTDDNDNAPGTQPLTAHLRAPEKLSKTLRGDLDNIVLMALRKEPERRYPSVEQFSGDIRRHLDNVPVHASKDSALYRASKFISRHKAGVAAAVIVIVGLSIGLGVALREARIAQRRFDDVRHLSNSMIFEIHDSIQDLPGSTSARKLIIDRALKYLDKLAQESNGDASLQRELAAAYKRVGDVQGNTLAANLGDSAGALDSYRKSLAIRKTVAAAHPANLTDGLSLAESFRSVASELVVTGDTAGAWRYSQDAARIGEESLKAHPEDLNVLEELSQDYAAQASILGGNFTLSNLGNPVKALEIRKKELAVDEKLFTLQPKSSSAERAYAVSLARLGDQHILVGQHHAALEIYLRAKAIFENLAATSPGYRAQIALQAIYNRLGVTELKVGNLQEALVYNRLALEVVRKLSLADSKDVRSASSLAIDYSNVAEVLSLSGNPRDAISMVAQAVSLMEKLVIANPSNGEILGIKASVSVTAGDVLSIAKDNEKAVGYYREAISILSERHVQDPGNTDGNLQLAGTYNQLGKLSVNMNELDTARETFHKALALSEPQANSPSPSEESLYSVADSYTGLGDAAVRQSLGQASEKRLKLLGEAHSCFEQSLNTWKKISEPGLTSPDGYHIVQPSLVQQKAEEVDRATRNLELVPH